MYSFLELVNLGCLLILFAQKILLWQQQKYLLGHLCTIRESGLGMFDLTLARNFHPVPIRIKNYTFVETIACCVWLF